jgi:hypothetical protein
MPDDIRELERSQDELAKALGYAMLRIWPELAAAETWNRSLAGVPRTTSDLMQIKTVLGDICHEVGRFADNHKLLQARIDELRSSECQT